MMKKSILTLFLSMTLIVANAQADRYAKMSDTVSKLMTVWKTNQLLTNVVKLNPTSRQNGNININGDVRLSGNVEFTGTDGFIPKIFNSGTGGVLRIQDGAGDVYDFYGGNITHWNTNKKFLKENDLATVYGLINNGNTVLGAGGTFRYQRPEFYGKMLTFDNSGYMGVVIPESGTSSDSVLTINLQGKVRKITQASLGGGGSSNIIAGNGLTKSGDSLKLGGDYTSPITIGGNNKGSIFVNNNSSGVNFSNNTSRNSINAGDGYAQMVHITGFDAVTGLAATNDGIIVSDDNGLKGMRYERKFRTGLTDRSIVDKEYIDSVAAIGSGTPVIPTIDQVLAAGNTTSRSIFGANYIAYTNSNSSTSYTNGQIIKRQSGTDYPLNLPSQAGATLATLADITSRGNLGNTYTTSTNLTFGQDATFTYRGTGGHTFSLQTPSNNPGGKLATIYNAGTGNLILSSADGVSTSIMKLDGTQYSTINIPVNGLVVLREVWNAAGSIKWGIISNSSDVVNSGGVTSVTGTTNEVTVSNNTTTPAVGISSAYTIARNAYADNKVQNSLNASTTIAPSASAVNTALSAKADLVGGFVPNSQLQPISLDSTQFEALPGGKIGIKESYLVAFGLAHGWGTLPSLAASAITFGTSTATQNVVNWSSVTNATSYLLKRSLSSSMTSSTTVYPSGTALTYTDTGLSANTPYYYTVTASATSYNSSTSAIGTKTTAASGGGDTLVDITDWTLENTTASTNNLTGDGSGNSRAGSAKHLNSGGSGYFQAKADGVYIGFGTLSNYNPSGNEMSHGMIRASNGKIIGITNNTTFSDDVITPAGTLIRIRMDGTTVYYEYLVPSGSWHTLQTKTQAASPFYVKFYAFDSASANDIKGFNLL